MEYLKSGWKTVVGAPSSNAIYDEQPNVAETVERLVERVETSTLLEDRRDACRALKSLSKTYRLEVGAKAMDAILFVLQNDSDDIDIIAFSLEILINIISGNDDDIAMSSHSNNVHQHQSASNATRNGDNQQDLSIQFTEIFIKRKENVQKILDLLSEFDFKIRWPTIKLLYCLLKNKLRECQDCILTHPMGISRMMDLLSDPREVIRNDALLLLVDLTKNNTNIQKIVAFENAFDRILDIITSEGYSDGGIIVEDCLTILLNLLKTNTSNQNFFKEGSYINRLLPFFDFSFETNWNTQKINNLLLMFKVIRSLVSPKNPQQVTSSCQKVMNQNEVLQKLCAILMSNGIPAEILTETINCVAEVIRGNQQNQDYFSRVNAPIDPPKPVIVILLMSMINEKQPLELRCAVLYCFQCFLYKNDLGQAQIVETLLPTSSDVSNFDVSAGQLLCSGFFSYDHLSNWFVAIALSSTILDNVTQKEQLLRVQLATDHNSSPTSLLAYCSSLLQQGGHYQRRISLLMLLSTWLTNCPIVVSNFVSLTTNIPYLTSQVGLIESDDVELIVQGLCAFLLGICICYNDNSVSNFTKDNLCQLIQNRIGHEIFIDKLSLISKNEKFSQAIQQPQLSYQKSSDILFDYEFCNLFRKQEPIILKIIQSPSPSSSLIIGNEMMMDPNSELTTLTNDDHRLLIKYKELIRQQDEQLTALRKETNELKNKNDYLQRQLNEQIAITQQLRDQLSLLKAQKSIIYNDPIIPTSSSSSTTTTTSATFPSPIVSSAEISAISFASNMATQNTDSTINSSSIQMFDNSHDQPLAESGYNTSGRTNFTHFNNVHDHSDQLNNQMSNLNLNPNDESSINVGNENSNNNVNTDNNDAATATTDNQQIDYLLNENRRLLMIIDQYKSWEQSYYAYYNQQQQQQQQQQTQNNNIQTNMIHPSESVQSLSLSTRVNVSDSDLSRHVSSELDRPSTTTKELLQSNYNADNNNTDTHNNHVTMAEYEKILAELETMKKEQDTLIALLGDQNLKIQNYEKRLNENNDRTNNLATDVLSMPELNDEIDERTSSNNVNDCQQPLYENTVKINTPTMLMNVAGSLESPPLVTSSVSTATNVLPLAPPTQPSLISTTSVITQSNITVSSSMANNLLPINENHYSLYSNNQQSQYQNYHVQQSQQTSQYMMMNASATNQQSNNEMRLNI